MSEQKSAADPDSAGGEPSDPRFTYPFAGWIGPAMRRAQAASYQHFIATVTKGELRPAQFTILLIIRDFPGLTQSRIGRMIRAKTANVAVLIHELEAMGLVRRMPRAAGSGRSQPLALTALGRRRVREWLVLAIDHEERLETAIGAGEVARLTAVLDRIVAAFENSGLPFADDPDGR